MALSKFELGLIKKANRRIELAKIREGLTFHYWTILKFNYIKNKRAHYVCQCICGKIKELKFIGKKLQSHSCGCKAGVNKKNNRRPTPEERLNIYSTIFNRYRREAKERGYEFSLSYVEFEQLVKQNCYYCNQEPSNEQWYNNRLKIRYNGVDRVDNTTGYITNNCVPCCTICNITKKAVTPIIIEKAYEFLFGKK